MKVSLHLGAHKTASTYLQKVLENNDDALRARRRLLVPMKEFRKAVTQKLAPGKGPPTARGAQRRAEAAAWLEEALSPRDADRLILTDENLLGSARQIVLAARPYPETHRWSVARLAPLLESHEVELFLAIRHQGDFARSIYCESLRGPLPEFVPPERFTQAWAAAPRSWLPLVEDILALFPGRRLTVWNYWLVKDAPQRILNSMTGMEPPMAFDLSSAYRRPSYSRDATAALLEIGARDGPEAIRRCREEVARAHPRGPANRAYRMWDRAANRAFARMLADDIKVLRGMGPAVRVLE